MRSLIIRVKRRIYPLVPPALVVRYRSSRRLVQSLMGKPVLITSSRSNVDLVVPASEARRWLKYTPPTHRVVEPSLVADTHTDAIAYGNTNTIADMSGAIGWQGTAAIVAADVESPTLASVDRGLSIVATGIVVAADVADGLRIAESEEVDPHTVLGHLVASGQRIRVIPNSPHHGEIRDEPVFGDRPVIILAAVPMHDVGGGSRGAQIALELVRRGHDVVYVHRYESQENVDLGIRYVHPRLEQVPFDRFDAATHISRSPIPGVVFVELPDPALKPAIDRLTDDGWKSVFDLIDDWRDPALGAGWYSPPFEESLAAKADVVMASAPDLMDQLRRHGRDDAVLMPNAVNTSVFDGRTVARPPDLPDGTIIGYQGSLYGEWIDWSAIRAIADERPDRSVVLIGERRGAPKAIPENVHFLGLKPQGDLPGYASHFDAAIVPFVVSQTTHAVSPLKVYEYLACGVPVAAPPLRSLAGLEGVYTDSDMAAAVEDALAADRPDAEAIRFEHSWTRRLSDLLPHVGWKLSIDIDDPTTIEYRKTVIYRSGQRHVMSNE